jgi:hypothetical protein
MEAKGLRCTGQNHPVRPRFEEPVEPAVAVITTDDRLHELARRCGELLVKNADACPPGHWLG